jgi:hypothetical protein
MQAAISAAKKRKAYSNQIAINSTQQSKKGVKYYV